MILIILTECAWILMRVIYAICASQNMQNLEVHFEKFLFYLQQLMKNARTAITMFSIGLSLASTLDYKLLQFCIAYGNALADLSNNSGVISAKLWKLRKLIVLKMNRSSRT